MLQENRKNSDLLILGEKVKQHYRPAYQGKLCMSHPGNNRSLYYQKDADVKLNQNSEAFLKRSDSYSLPNLDQTDTNGIDSSTQTSKTILQLAELEAGYLSPDSLTSSPKQTNKSNKTDHNLTSCSENIDIPIPYIRKSSIQNYLYQCYDKPEDNIKPCINGSLTNTFLAKKHNEETASICKSRSQFLQQTSPLRNLSSCNPECSFKSQSYLEPGTSACKTIKKELPNLSRFTIKNIRNQVVVDPVPLIYWGNTEIGEYRSKDKKNLKNTHNIKRDGSFMLPTIASEQRNQQVLVKSFDQLMSPNKRGRSLSPNRVCYVNSKESKFFDDDVKSEVSNKKTNVKKRSNCYNGAKSSCLLTECKENDELVKLDLSRLSITSAKVQHSRSTPTTSSENVIFQIMTRVKDNEWSVALKALTEVIECSRSLDTELLLPHMTTINQRLIQLLRSPRSHVCRTSCQMTGHLFETMKDTRRPEFDDIVEILLSKTADSNKFIRKDANLSLDCMVTHIPIYHTVRSLCLKGPIHKNPLVRSAMLRLIVCAVVIAGPDVIMNLAAHEATRKRIIILFPQFLFDKHLETRKYGGRLFKILSQEHNFEHYLKKYLDANDLSRITSLLKSRELKK